MILLYLRLVWHNCSSCRFILQFSLFLQLDRHYDWRIGFFALCQLFWGKKVHLQREGLLPWMTSPSLKIKGVFFATQEGESSSRAPYDHLSQHVQLIHSLRVLKWFGRISRFMPSSRLWHGNHSYFEVRFHCQIRTIALPFGIRRRKTKATRSTNTIHSKQDHVTNNSTSVFGELILNCSISSLS